MTRRAAPCCLLARKCYINKDAAQVALRGIIYSADVVGHISKAGQYVLGRATPPAEACVSSAAVKGTVVIWHRRNFHLRYTNLEKAARIVDGMPRKEVIRDRVSGAVCPPCV